LRVLEKGNRRVAKMKLKVKGLFPPSEVGYGEQVQKVLGEVLEVEGIDEEGCPTTDKYYPIDTGFFVEDVLYYNLAPIPDCTTINFRDGFGLMIQMPFDKFGRLFDICRG
jgi:hypothetical protein